MHMNDLNRFNIPKNFIIDWDRVERMLRESPYPSDRVLLDRFFPKRPGGAGGTTTASSTSGAVPVKQVPAAGEQWWVKAPDQPRLILVGIVEITGTSVSIKVEDYHTLLGLRGGRYERDYLKFVEKYVEPSLEPKSV